MAKRRMTQTQLRAACRRWVPWWRDRLGLRDWHIDVQYCTATEMGDALASVLPDFARRWVPLRVLEAPNEAWDRHDLEEVIVHELLHIHMGTVGARGGDYTPSRCTKAVLLEQTINALAACLVRLRRKGARA